MENTSNAKEFANVVSLPTKNLSDARPTMRRAITEGAGDSNTVHSVHSYWPIEQFDVVPACTKVNINYEHKSLLRCVDLSVEIKILFYLHAYGDTRENDLMAYGARRLGKSAENMKEILDGMAGIGRIRRIVHGELEPQVTYIATGPTLEPELEIEAIAGSLGMNFNQQDIEWCKRLLEEASIAAERELKERYPEEFADNKFGKKRY